MDRHKEESRIQKIFLKTALWNHWAKISQFGLNFLFTILLARKLGETLYGQYSLWISICFFLTILTNFGFENIINTYIPKLDHNPKRTSFLVNRLILIRSAVLIIGLTILLAISKAINNLSFSIPNGVVFICLMGYVISNSLSSLLGRVLISQYLIKYLSIINVVTAIFQLITAYILLSIGYSLNSVLIIVSIASILLFILCFVGTYNTIKYPKESFNLRPLFIFGKNAWLTSIVEFGLGKQLDIILIGYFITAKSEAGYYNLAVTTVIILSGLTTAGLGGVALAVFSEIEKKWGINKLKVAWESLIKLEYLLSVPLIAFLAVYAHPVIKAVYTESYIAAVPMIQLYACFFIFQRLLGGGIHITTLYSMEKAKNILIARIIGGFLNLILNLILIPLYGGIGAIVATGNSILVTVLLEYLYTRKYVSKSYPIQFIFKVSICVTAALIITRIIEVQTFYSIIYVGIAYGLLLFFLLYLLKPLDKNDQKIINNLNISFLRYLSLFCR